MNPEMTLCFYLLIGIAVSVALWLRGDVRSRASDLFQVMTAPFFWPIYLPILLARRSDSLANSGRLSTDNKRSYPNDSMAMAITQVEQELDAALQSLDGWAEDVQSEERVRIAELKSAWRQQASHIRELDQLLAPSLVEPPETVRQPATTEQSDRASATALEELPHAPRSIEHERVRLENIMRLKQLRRSLLDDLMATVAWVRELVTMIHLAKYTGAPASRAHELVKQIASAVQGLSELHRTVP